MTARPEFQMISRVTPGAKRPGHRGRLRWAMTACVPMLFAALALVAAGIASPGVLVIAIGCTIMTGIMMTGRRPRHRRRRWLRLAGRSPGQADAWRNRRHPAPGTFTPAPPGSHTPASRLAMLGASPDQTRAYPIIRERPSSTEGSPQSGEPRSAS